MGSGLALQAREHGFEVMGLDPQGVHPELQAAGVEPMTALSDITSSLAPPRVVFLYVPAGPDVDTLLDNLVHVLAPGDVIVDGGSSYWSDSIRRHARLARQGLELVDAGTSGVLERACFMVGGTDAAVACVEPIFKTLAVAGGYVHAGPPGAGHFTKLVHDGIELGMLKALGEGIERMREYESDLDLAGILACWRHGSVIRGSLIEVMHDELVKHGHLDDVSSFFEDEVSSPVAVLGRRFKTRAAARARPLLRHRMAMKAPRPVRNR